MKRPQSAKQVRNYWPTSTEEAQPDSKHPFKHSKVRMGNFVSTSNDLSRLLPKRIQQDKEKLYCETLQLKSLLNEMGEENLRLKTKVAILEKEKERIRKSEDMRVPSRGTLNSADKENQVVTTLKKMVRQSKEEAQGLKVELSKLKRTIRYTKLNEVQVEKQTIIEQNKRQAKIIVQLQTELSERLSREEELQELERKIKEQKEEIREVAQDNAEYEQMLEEMHIKNRELSEKVVVIQKKLQRDIAVQKRKVDQLIRLNDNLKKEKQTMEARIEEATRAKKSTRPASSHPYSSASQPPQNRSVNVPSKEKEQALEHNQRLKKELEQAKQLLAASESRLKQKLDGKGDETFELVITKNEAEEFFVKETKPGKNAGQKIKGHKLSLALQQIREVLTYRMKYNRYTFDELKSDILDSPIKQFSSEDLISMLTDEPFFLSKEHAVQFLLYCYQENQLKSNSKISTAQLIHCLRQVIDSFELLPEEEEEQTLYKIADFITRNRPLLEKEFTALSGQDNFISKQQLEQVLLKGKELGQQEIDLAICYVAVNHETLSKLNYLDLLDKFMIEESRSRKESKDLEAKAAEELSLGENEDLPEEDEDLGDDII